MIRERFQPEMSKDTLISIIDDDALARDGIGALVESLGYNVIGGAFSPI
jgi:FixJ family two-component response regulator